MSKSKTAAVAATASEVFIGILLCTRLRFGRGGRRERYTANSIAGGFQVPLPGGRIDGASVFGQ